MRREGGHAHLYELATPTYYPPIALLILAREGSSPFSKTSSHLDKVFSLSPGIFVAVLKFSCASFFSESGKPVAGSITYQTWKVHRNTRYIHKKPLSTSHLNSDTGSLSVTMTMSPITDQILCLVEGENQARIRTTGKDHPINPALVR